MKYRKSDSDTCKSVFFFSNNGSVIRGAQISAKSATTGNNLSKSFLVFMHITKRLKKLLRVTCLKNKKRNLFLSIINLEKKKFLSFFFFFAT